MSWQEVLKANGGMKPHKLITIAGQKYLFVAPKTAYPFFANHPVLGDRTGRKQRESNIKPMTQTQVLEQARKVLKIEKKLYEWFENEAEGEDGETVSGWVSCQSCEDDKKGVKPCGRDDADEGRKQRCRKNCAACKTYKRRKGK